MKNRHFSIESNGRGIHCSLWEKQLSENLAVILPGMSYPAEGPILFFLKTMYLNRGWDILSVEYRYNENEAFMALEEKEQEDYIDRDGEALLSCLEDFREYSRFCFIGKSLGTLMMRKIPADFRQNSSFIWLTPILSFRGIMTAMTEENRTSSVIIGTHDPYYDEEHVRNLRRNPGCRVLVLDGAGHVLESGKDVLAMVENHRIAMEFLLEE